MYLTGAFFFSFLGSVDSPRDLLLFQFQAGYLGLVLNGIREGDTMVIFPAPHCRRLSGLATGMILGSSLPQYTRRDRWEAVTGEQQ